MIKQSTTFAGLQGRLHSFFILRGESYDGDITNDNLMMLLWIDLGYRFSHMLPVVLELVFEFGILIRFHLHGLKCASPYSICNVGSVRSWFEVFNVLRISNGWVKFLAFRFVVPKEPMWEKISDAVHWLQHNYLEAGRHQQLERSSSHHSLLHLSFSSPSFLFPSVMHRAHA